MKKIKLFQKLLLSSLLLTISFSLPAQLLKRLGDRVEQKAKDRANRKVDQAIDKGLDKAEGGVDGAAKKKNKNTNTKEATENDELGNENNKSQQTNGNSKNGLKVDSKFDFISGEKIVLIEDFTKDNIGDFPDKWNTNGSGEIVTTNIATGRFLETKKEVVLYPEWLKSLPENFTLECDVLCTDNFNFYSQAFFIGFTTAKDISKDWRAFGRFGHGGENNSSVEVGIHPTNAGGQQGITYFSSVHKTKETLKNEADQTKFYTKDGKTKVHVAIWRQKQRVRVYLDDKKVWDIPKAIEAGVIMNSIYFRNSGGDKEADAFYLGNIRVAVGAPDTRNKLITEGKFSTSGILFDVNSDKIKPESYGVVKDIANVLSENAEVKVKIIGHTDSDGDGTKNMELSKKRAAAVKNMLSKDFNIDGNRMETDGKGATQPTTKNDTPENKAQNRRVEFIKI
jgi:outer membrane protein OmpA-like peptidoglycan-associated protein